MTLNVDDLWAVLDLYRSWSVEFPMPCPINRGGQGDRVQPSPGALPMPWRFLIEVGKALACLNGDEYSTLMLYHTVRLAMMRAADRTGDDFKREAQGHRKALDRMRHTDVYRNAVTKACTTIPVWCGRIANQEEDDSSAMRVNAGSCRAAG